MLFLKLCSFRDFMSLFIFMGMRHQTVASNNEAKIAPEVIILCSVSLTITSLIVTTLKIHCLDPLFELWACALRCFHGIMGLLEALHSYSKKWKEGGKRVQF